MLCVTTLIKIDQILVTVIYFSSPPSHKAMSALCLLNQLQDYDCTNIDTTLGRPHRITRITL